MKKILIIEDDIFLGNVLVEKLKNEGFDVHLARDGAVGLQNIKEVKPDLILLDIILPNINGYEILEAKQKDPDIESIPVIIISNSGQPVEINRALTLGVKDYLVKAQFNPEDVLVKVKNQFMMEENEKTGSGPKVSLPQSKDSDNLEGRKVMWIEDDKFLNDIIAHKLASKKCISFHSSDGEEALEIIDREMPDVVLLDIILSGMDGFEILKRLKANPKVKNIPVILLSNLGQPGDTKKGQDLGAARFLIKATVTLDEIMNQIQSVISESKK